MKIRNLFAALLISSITITSFGCTDRESAEEKQNNKLNGTWEVLSYRLSGLEQMNIVVESFELHFAKNGEETGHATLTLTYPNTQVIEEHGDYVVEEDGNKLLLRGTRFNIQITGDDQLYIEGDPGGINTVYQAEKK